MTDGPLEPSTPEAVAATAQSRGKAAPVPAVAARDPCARLGKDYRLGRGVERVPPAPFERKHADPVYRPLRIYTIDPAVSRRRCGPIEALNFANLRFKGDLGSTAGPEELRRQACVLGECVTRPEYRDEFGLVADGDPRLAGDTVSLPRVESIRSSRRVGPDGQIAFDLVAEVTQRRTVRAGNGGFECHGGSTVILGSGGEIRYVISKSVVGEGRVERRRESLLSKNGQRYWTQEGDRYVPKERFFRLLDEPKCR